MLLVRRGSKWPGWKTGIQGARGPWCSGHPGIIFHGDDDNHWLFLVGLYYLVQWGL